MLSEAARSLERTGLTTWTVGTIPRTFTAEGTNGLVGYPALVDRGATVSLTVLPTEAEQRSAHWAGVRRLLLLGVPSPLKWVSGRLDNRAKLTLTQNPHGSLPALLADCSAAAADEILTEAGGPPWDAEGFGKLLDRVRAELNERVLELLRGAQQVIAEWRPLTTRLAEPVPAPLRPAVDDLTAQVARAGGARVRGRDRAPAAAGPAPLPGRGQPPAGPAGRRRGPGRGPDGQGARGAGGAGRGSVAGLPPGRREADEVRQLRWMVEELRVSLFAQSLGTPYPVSEQRIYRAMDELG